MDSGEYEKRYSYDNKEDEGPELCGVNESPYLSFQEKKEQGEVCSSYGH